MTNLTEQAREILRQWADEMSNVSWWISCDVLTIRNLPHELDTSDLVDRMAAALAIRNAPIRCQWTTDVYGQVHTTCDKTLELNEGASPVSLGLKFCGFCGAPLTSVRFNDEGLAKRARDAGYP